MKETEIYEIKKPKVFTLGFLLSNDNDFDFLKINPLYLLQLAQAGSVQVL